MAKTQELLLANTHLLDYTPRRERLPVCECFNFQCLPIRAYDHIITISVIRRAPALCFIILICAIR
jgi:hypothetical protein